MCVCVFVFVIQKEKRTMHMRTHFGSLVGSADFFHRPALLFLAVNSQVFVLVKKHPSFIHSSLLNQY